jgi:hypothetical protein
MFVPVTPVTVNVVKIYKGHRSDLPAPMWWPGGSPAVPAGHLRSSAETAALPQLHSKMVLFLGDNIDWRAGEGQPLYFREPIQNCLVHQRVEVQCQGYKMSYREFTDALREQRKECMECRDSDKVDDGWADD